MVDTPRKTFPELQALSAPVLDTDVLAVYRTPGPAKRTTASVLGSYVNTVIGTAFTRTLLDDADAATARTTLGAVGSAALAATTGATLVGILRAGVGAVAETLASWVGNLPLSVKSFGAVGDGTTDDGPAFRLAQTAALLIGRTIYVPASASPYIIGPDPAAPTAGGFLTYSLKILSNTTWDIQGQIKAANGITSWNRVVDFGAATNVKVFGCLDVDANVQNASATTNEHMHGVYLYNSSDIWIERLRSVNARGDNLFIGGTSETVKSERVWIGRVDAKTAGRKNMVWQHFNAIDISSAYLDNSAGGAAIYTGGVPDNTDKHCFDVEPDAFTGAAQMRGAIGSLYTFGTGNDFTAGTTATVADACVIDIARFVLVKSASSTVQAHMQNAITLNIGQYTLIGLAGASADITIGYAARLNVDNWSISGAAVNTGSNFVVIGGIGTDYPIVNAANMTLNCTSALCALRWENGPTGYIGNLQLKAPINLPIRHVGTGGASVLGQVFYGRIVSENSGDVGLNNCVVALTPVSGEIPVVSIDEMVMRDSRGSPTTRAILVDSGMSVGLTLKNFKTSLSATPVAWIGSDTFYSRVGIDNGPRDFVCNGTPESMITAPVGSAAYRLDGSTSTTLYIKTSGTGNTGWTAK